jgi:hypothetical protein
VCPAVLVARSTSFPYSRTTAVVRVRLYELRGAYSCTAALHALLVLAARKSKNALLPAAHLLRSDLLWQTRCPAQTCLGHYREVRTAPSARRPRMPSARPILEGCLRWAGVVDAPLRATPTPVAVL